MIDVGNIIVSAISTASALCGQVGQVCLAALLVTLFIMFGFVIFCLDNI